PVDVAGPADHGAGHRGAGRARQPQGQRHRRPDHRLCRDFYGVPAAGRLLPEVRRGAVDHGAGTGGPAGRPVRHRLRGGALMTVMRFVRRGLTFLRTEVFVLPSRIIVLLFALGLLALPLFTDDPYILRILIMTSLLATFAASWDFLAGYSGQVNFGHALFFGAAA